MSSSHRTAAGTIAIVVLVTGIVWMSAKAVKRTVRHSQRCRRDAYFQSDGKHPYYSGEFHLTGGRATLVGSMSDPSPWDHLDYAGKHLTPVRGTIEINVYELVNTGLVVAEFAEGPDQYRVVFDRFRGRGSLSRRRHRDPRLGTWRLRPWRFTLSEDLALSRRMGESQCLQEWPTPVPRLFRTFHGDGTVARSQDA